MIFLSIVYFFLIVVGTIVNCTKSLAGAPAEGDTSTCLRCYGRRDVALSQFSLNLESKVYSTANGATGKLLF